MATTTLVWFRKDLRLSDNPALSAAVENGHAIPVFILDEKGEGDWPPGAASRWWLHHSLTSLAKDLARHHSKLILRRGNAAELLVQLGKDSDAEAVVWNDRYEPAALKHDRAVKEHLEKAGLKTASFKASLMFAPGEITTNDGQPYKVYTPFWKKLRTLNVPAPLSTPKLNAVQDLKSDDLDTWALLPKKPDWAKGFKARWSPGETGAWDRLEKFYGDGLPHYGQGRDFPAIEATSGLSPHLHWGEIGPRQIWHFIREKSSSQNAEKFLSELAWREFAAQLLYFFPQLPEMPFRKEFEKFKWASNSALLKAWQRGQTGFPIVDAGMRELWQTGVMHNRVRMIVASFLTKDLLIPWQEGQAWFWDTLVDADLASNSFNWQWVAGSGADASPYFRIFNPELQSRKFDEQGEYIRRYVPELAKLPSKHIHAPEKADEETLKKAGVVLGTTYPVPIVDHGAARDAALQAYKKLG